MEKVTGCCHGSDVAVGNHKVSADSFMMTGQLPQSKLHLKEFGTNKVSSKKLPLMTNPLSDDWKMNLGIYA